MVRSNRTEARKIRSSHGQQLVEVMVAVAMSGFLAVMLGASLAQLLSTSTVSENQLKAGDVAQELLDRIRRTPYGLISGATNTYTVQMYSDDGIVPNNTLPFQTTPTGTPVPLLCNVDSSQYTWSNASLANRFRGPGPNGYATATANLQPYTLNSAHNATLATITITWAENQSVRSFVLQSVISNDGIHQ